MAIARQQKHRFSLYEQHCVISKPATLWCGAAFKWWLTKSSPVPVAELHSTSGRVVARPTCLCGPVTSRIPWGGWSCQGCRLLVGKRVISTMVSSLFQVALYILQSHHCLVSLDHLRLALVNSLLVYCCRWDYRSQQIRLSLLLVCYLYYSYYTLWYSLSIQSLCLRIFQPAEKIY